MKTKNATVTVAKAQNMAAEVVEQASKLRSLGQVVIQKTIEAGSAYLELCRYIRAKSCTQKLVTFELTEIGFHKARVSEIIRVAHASDEHFSQFEARTIGFRKTLELERGNVQQLLAKEAGSPVIDIESEVEEITTLGKKAVIEDNAESKARAIENAAKKILDYGEFENIRSKKWTLANGWTLALTRDADWKSKQAKAELEAAKAAEAKAAKKVPSQKLHSDAKQNADGSLTWKAPESPAAPVSAPAR